MLNEPGKSFDDKVVHRYAGETKELRTVARLLYDDSRDWEFERLWFDIEFMPYEHTAAYTVFLARWNEEQIKERMRVVVPATSASHGFLFTGNELSLAYELQEWSRAAYYLWQRTREQLMPIHGEDYIEVVLVDFLRRKAEELEYENLCDRLRQLPINSPKDGETAEGLRNDFQTLYDIAFEVLENIAADQDSPIEPDVLVSEGPQQVLDLWADLEWYDPYWEYERK